MKVNIRVVAVLTAAALAVGCGQDRASRPAEAGPSPPAEEAHPRKDRAKAHGKLQHVDLTLDGHEGPTAVGIMMAASRGFFADVGLSVGIFDPATPNRPVRYVADGAVDLGVTHEPEVALARERGAPIVAVGSLVPKPTAAMIWTKDSKVHSIAGLKGKTIAVPGLPFQERFLRSVLAGHGLSLGDVEVKRVGYELVNSLLFGRADAIFGGSWNLEGVELEELALKPTVTRVRSVGIPPYDELVVIARSDRVAKDPKLFRDFMTAVARGTAAAVRDPAAAVSVVEEADEGNPDATAEVTEAEVEATLPLLSRHGYVSPGQARGLGRWMYEQGMVRREPRISQLLTDRYR
jgi:putative hydroxymethylpyrimidine transport system substrate-binding protein